ncbi:MAG: 1,4-dihydroxy-6-naphthoate synthase [Planctomycetota bacterium]|nr:1,4-dihydroxy-6-naphthoate synthase [Planctomycetota bacterium]MDA1165091.1 1,4-dihydroxy-6-naphthoate synthase [Planctomycetota bacterium]
MTQKIHLGISTCPNDTFTFHALMTRNVDWRGLEFDVELIDIQQLNDRLFEGDFDAAKTSFHAALLLANETVVLPSGSALGFGVGPLLLSAGPDTSPTDNNQITLCPGKHTTASLLNSLFHPATTRVEHVVFSEIMPMLQRREADFGVCIHEGRFTWQQQGLGLVEDLGTRWETETGCPLPLGGIVARRKLGDRVIAAVQSVIRDSLEFALADRDAALPTMRQYAQEFDDNVLMKHVDLYVNQWTTDLGVTGQNALDQLSQRAQSIGLVSETDLPIEVFKTSASLI